jgi:hypothetical protein
VREVIWGRRLAFVVLLSLLLAFAVSSGAGARSGTQKYKLKFNTVIANCGSCKVESVFSLEITDNFGSSCRPFFIFLSLGSSHLKKCFGGYPPGTKVVLRPSPDPEFELTNWLGDCAGQPTDKCVLVMDSNKSFGAQWVAP